jgi:lysophospholipase L1-like esterase
MRFDRGIIALTCLLLAACGGGGGGGAGGQTGTLAATSQTTLLVIELYGNSTQKPHDIDKPASYYINLPGYTVSNRGLSGTTTRDLLNGYTGILPWTTQMRQSSAAVVITNHCLVDATLLTLTEYKDNLRAIADAAAGKRIFFETCNPTAVRPLAPVYAQAMRDVAAEKGIYVLDVELYLNGLLAGRPITTMMPDGDHPSAATHEIIGEFLEQELRARL